MAARQLSNGDDAGTVLGQSSSDLIGFHGASPSDQAAGITLATNATIATIRTAVRSVIALLSEKGLAASGP